MKKKYSPLYFILEALKSLKRNGVMTFASVAVLLSCLIVIGGFSLLVLNINFNLEKLNMLNEIVVFTEKDADDDTIASVEGEIKALDNVAEYSHKTREDVLSGLKESQPDVYGDISDEENPYSDEFTIKYTDNSKVPDMVYKLKNVEGVRKIRNDLNTATKLKSIKDGIMLIFIWFLVLLFVVSVFIIINTVKLSVFSRRTEIGIMRYIGATGWFITLPFMIEGILIGIASGIAAYFVIRFAYIFLVEKITESVSMLSFVPFADISGTVILAFVAIGVMTGIIGSGISLGKYLKK